MAVPAGFVLALSRREAVPLAAGTVAGSYGAPVALALDRGLYLVMSDGAVGVRDSSDNTMRTDGAGAKLEVPVTPGVPLAVLCTSTRLVLAAKDGAAVAFVVPLVPATEDAAAFVEKACNG
jgi:hypothetical protein